MKTRKAIFVTILVSVMLAVIDACLYILCNPAFVVLTGVVVIYGLLRGASDFCHWLNKPDPESERPAKKPAPIEPNGAGGAYDWASDAELEDADQNSHDVDNNTATV